MILFFQFWKNETKKNNISQNQLFVESIPHHFQTFINLADERTRFLQDLYSKYSDEVDINDLIKNYLLDQRYFKGAHYVPIADNHFQQSIWYLSDCNGPQKKKLISSIILSSTYQKWCWEVTQNRWGKWSEPIYLPFLDMNYGILYSIPIYKDLKKENLIGVLSVVIDIEWLRLNLEQIKGTRAGDFVLISHSGNYIVHPYNQYKVNQSIKNVISDRYDDVDKSKMLRQFLNSNAGYSDQENKDFKESEQKYHYFWNTVPVTSWKIVYKVPTHIAEKGNFGDIVWIFVILTLILIVSIVYTVIHINYEFKPIRELAVQRNTQKEETVKNEFFAISDHIEELTKERDIISDELEKHSIQNKSISEELRIARHVQQSILPHGKIIHPSVKMAADLIPANKIGGDLYDYFMIDAHRLCIAIGDVSGHGIGASLYMTIAQTVIHRQVESGIASAADIVERINNELCNEKNYELFLTLFFGILDLETGWLDYCNSGHSFPYILSSKSSKLQRLEETHGIPIGIYPNKKYSSNQVRINNNDILFAYTDGVLEERDQNNQLFSTERLEEILRNTYKKDPEKIIYEIKGQLSKFRGTSEQSDDITLLAIKYLKKKVDIPESQFKLN